MLLPPPMQRSSSPVLLQLPPVLFIPDKNSYKASKMHLPLPSKSSIAIHKTIPKIKNDNMPVDSHEVRPLLSHTTQNVQMHTNHSSSNKLYTPKTPLHSLQVTGQIVLSYISHIRTQKLLKEKALTQAEPTSLLTRASLESKQSSIHRLAAVFSPLKPNKNLTNRKENKYLTQSRRNRKYYFIVELAFQFITIFSEKEDFFSRFISVYINMF